MSASPSRIQSSSAEAAAFVSGNIASVRTGPAGAAAAAAAAARSARGRSATHQAKVAAATASRPKATIVCRLRLNVCETRSVKEEETLSRSRSASTSPARW